MSDEILNDLIISADGTKKWYVNSTLHREDGPAIEYVDGGNPLLTAGILMIIR